LQCVAVCCSALQCVAVSNSYQEKSRNVTHLVKTIEKKTIEKKTIEKKTIEEKTIEEKTI